MVPQIAEGVNLDREPAEPGGRGEVGEVRRDSAGGKCLKN